MTNPDDVDQEHGVEDFVNDSEVADPDPEHRVLALHRDAVRRPRIVGKKIEGCSDPLLLAALKGVLSLGCPWHVTQGVVSLGALVPGLRFAPIDGRPIHGLEFHTQIMGFEIIVNRTFARLDGVVVVNDHEATRR